MRCDGIGSNWTVEDSVLVTDPSKSIENGCFGLSRERGSYKHLSIREDVVRGLCLEHRQNTEAPFSTLSSNLVQELLNGTETPCAAIDCDGKKSGSKVIFHGFVPVLMKLSQNDDHAGNYAEVL